MSHGIATLARGAAPLGRPLAADRRALLAGYVRRVGEPAAVATLGVSRATLARALAGLGVRGVTIVAIGAALERVEPAPTPTVLAAPLPLAPPGRNTSPRPSRLAGVR
ncbi:MAG: hypothetical protein HY908_02080 [Myxococcales bacterium]|nr:hypothetical protein [Myxococcales bacterium]